MDRYRVFKSLFFRLGDIVDCENHSIDCLTCLVSVYSVAHDVAVSVVAEIRDMILEICKRIR